MSSYAIPDVIVYGYASVATVFLLSTYVEGWHAREGWSFFRILGLLSCFIWPAVALAVILSAQRRGRGAA